MKIDFFAYIGLDDEPILQEVVENQHEVIREHQQNTQIHKTLQIALFTLIVRSEDRRPFFVARRERKHGFIVKQLIPDNTLPKKSKKQQKPKILHLFSFSSAKTDRQRSASQ